MTMSENFVRKTLNVKDIKAKESYTLHDLDLLETEDGRVFIRIKRKNTEFNNEGDRYAYFYQLTNNIKMINDIPLYPNEQTANSGNIHLPLIMDVQHLVGKIQITMCGKDNGYYKINGIAGTFDSDKEITTFDIPLSEGQSIPDLTLKRGNKVLAVYQVFQADLNQLDSTHPEYIKGAKQLLQRVTQNETNISQLTTKVRNAENNIKTLQQTPITYQCYQDKTKSPNEYGIITNDPHPEELWYAFCDGNQFMTTDAQSLVQIQQADIHVLPNGFTKITLGSPFVGWSKLMLYRKEGETRYPIVCLQSYPADITIEK